MTKHSPVGAIPGVPGHLIAPMTALMKVACDLSRTIARGPLSGALGAEMGDNSGGDRQKALDVIADDMFAAALVGTGVRFYASEERDKAEVIDADGTLALAIDPLDGSSNIDVNVSIGTIFSIFPAADSAEASFLRPGREQIAGGYVIYGPQTVLVVTFGAGVHQALLDPTTGDWVALHTTPAIPPQSNEFAINAANYRHWPKAIRAYIDDCLAGETGPRSKNFNMRWVASLVAETHRILTRGGVFLYPGDARKGYERGRLRMVYECAPIAFVIEQAGGQATDGSERILSLTPPSLHARTPFVFGSSEKVDRVTVYNDLPEQELSALFGSRGLFRI